MISKEGKTIKMCKSVVDTENKKKSKKTDQSSQDIIISKGSKGSRFEKLNDEKEGEIEDERDINLTPQIQKRKQIIFYSLIIGGTILLLTIIGLSIGLPLSKKKKKEKFVTKINREINEIVRYRETKNTSVEIDMGEKTSVSESQMITDFIINIYGVDDQEEYTKYDAYAVVLNMTQINGTESVYLGGLDIFGSPKGQEQEQKDQEQGEEKKDDETKEKEDIENNKELRENKEEEEEEEDFEFSLDEEDTEAESENSEEEPNYLSTIPMVKFSFFENGTIASLYYPKNISTISLASLEDIIQKVTPQISEKLYNANQTLRNLDDLEVTNNYESDGNITTLTQKESTGITSKEGINFKGSVFNTDTVTKINDTLGQIEAIKAEGKASFQNDGTFNEDYQMDPESPMSEEDIKDENSNLITTDLKGISANSSSEILFLYKERNLSITEELHNISSTLHYQERSNSTETKAELRILQALNLREASVYKRNLSEIPRIKSKKDIRRLEISKSIEKTLDFSYAIFKTNVVGIQMSMSAVTLVNPKKGQSNVDIVLSVGEHSFKIYTINEDSKLGWGLIKAIEISDKFVKFLREINKSLNGLIPDWIINVIEQISGMNSLLTNNTKDYDISELYSSPMKKIVGSVQNYTGIVFDTIEKVVKTSNTKLNEIINEIETAKLGKVKEIFDTVKEKYYTFVNTFKDTLEIFHDNVLGFIKKVLEKIKDVTDFQIDVLYDIIEQFEGVQDIYDNYIAKVFGAVETGITKFQDTLNEKTKNIVGKGIKIVDFIIKALEDNIFLRLSTKKEKREALIIVLKNFTQNIDKLVDTIFTKIKDNFSFEIGANSTSKLRLGFVDTLETKLKDFKNKSESMLDKVKEKIDLVPQFDDFLKKLDSLEDIENIISDVMNGNFEKYFYIPFKNIEAVLFNDTVISNVKSKLQKKTNEIKDILKAEAQEIAGFINEKIKELIEKNSHQLGKFSNNIVQNLDEETIVKIQYELKKFYGQVQTIIIKRIRDNYKLGTDYIESISKYHSEKDGLRRTRGFEERTKKFLEGFSAFRDNLNANLKNILKDQYRTFVSSLKKSINSIDILPDFLKKYKDLAVISSYISFTKEINSKIDKYLYDSLFEENFPSTISAEINSATDEIIAQFKASIKEFDYYQYKDCKDDYCYNGFKGGLICVSGGTAKNVDLITTKITKEFFEQYTAPIMNEPLTTTQTYAKDIRDLFSKFNEPINEMILLKKDSFPELTEKVEELIAESKNIIKNYLGEDLLKSAYNLIQKGLDSNLTKYYDDIQDGFSKINTTFIDKFLSINTTSFLEKPKEIIFKLTQIIQNYIKKGSGILENIQDSLTTEINFVIKNVYSSVSEIISSNFKDISSTFPEFPEVFVNERLNLIKEKAASIKNSIANEVNNLINKEKQASILGVQIKDFFNIEKTLSSLQNVVTSKFNSTQTIVKTTIEKLFDNTKSLRRLSSTSKYNFQISKVRNVLKHFDTIKKYIQQIIVEKDFNVFDLTEFTGKFKDVLGNKVFDFVEKVQTFLQKINNESLDLILPTIDKIQYKISSVIQEYFNEDVIDNKVKVLTDKVMIITDSFKGIQAELLKFVEEKFVKIFANAANAILKRTNGFYKLNETMIKESYEVIRENVTYQIDSFINITFNTTLKFATVEDVIYVTVGEYQKKIDSFFKTAQTKLKEISQKYNSYLKLLNTSFDVPEIVLEKLEFVYKNISNEVLFNCSGIINKGFESLKVEIRKYVEETKDNVLSLLDNSFNRFYEVLSKSEPDTSKKALRNLEENQSSYKIIFNIREISATTLEEIFNQTMEYKEKALKLFSKEGISDMLIQSVKEKLGLLDMITDFNGLEDPIKAGFELLKKECQERLEIEIVKFAHEAKNITKTKFNETVSSFLTSFGKNYADKIKSKIITHGIEPSIDFIQNKIDELSEFFEKILGDTQSMGATTKLLISQAIPNLVDLVEEKVFTQVKNVGFKMIDKLSSSSGEKLINYFQSFVKSSKVVKALLNEDVIDKVLEQFDHTFIKELTESFKEIAEEKLFSQFKASIETSLKEKVSELKSTLNENKGKILSAIKEKAVETIGDALSPVLSQIKEFKDKIPSKIGNFLFNITGKPEEAFSKFVSEFVSPVVTSISSKYNLIQDKIIEKLYEAMGSVGDMVNKVIEKLPTKKLSEKVKEIKAKVTEYFEIIKEKVIDFLIKIKDKVSAAIKGIWSLKKNREKELRDTSTVFENLGQIKEVFQNLVNNVGRIQDTITTIKDSIQMVGNFDNFKKVIENGIKHVKDPFINSIEKFKTLITEEKLEEFKTKIETQIEKIIPLVSSHFGEISEVITEVIQKVMTSPKEVITYIKEKGKDILDKSLDYFLEKVISLVPAIEKTFQKQMPTTPIVDIWMTVFGIPFNFNIKFSYGFGAGFGLGTKELSIYLEVFVEANAKISASATAGVGIIQLGAGIEGLIGQGRLALRPSFYLKDFRVELDAYFKIEAFSFDVFLLMTYPNVKLTETQLPFVENNLTLYIPSVSIENLKYGLFHYDGISYEKHFLKDY